MDANQRRFLEEQQRARIQVEQEVRLEQERKEKKVVLERAFEQVSDLVLPSKGKIISICVVIGVIVELCGWFFGSSEPGETVPIGVPLFGGAIIGAIVGLLIVSAATRFKIWAIIAQDTEFRLWHAPLGFGIIFPVVGLLFGMGFSVSAIWGGIWLGVLVGVVVSTIVFWIGTNRAAVLMANASMSAADAVHEIRITNSR